MEWLHHLPEGVNLSTKLSDEALELWRCTWERQVTLGGMASIPSLMSFMVVSLVM